MAGIGQILQAIFGSSQNTSGSGSGSQNNFGQSSSSGNTTNTPNENPIFTQFRNSILPAIAAQYASAQQPVYGNAQVSQLANQSNQATNAGEQANTARAARSGTLNAGNTAATNAGMQAANTANVNSFQNSIPALNQAAKFNQTQNLLGLATGFLGQSPIGSTVQSNQTGTNTGQTQSTNTSTQNQNSPGIFG